MRVLYVAYPLLPVSSESAGGAEQVLWSVEREIAARGHATAVAACDGSTIAGDLLRTCAPPQAADDFDQRVRAHNRRVTEIVRERRGREAFDLVHDMSGHFWPHARELDVPVLATLHLPRHFYAPEMFAEIPGNLWFNCVSQSQWTGFRDVPGVVGVVANGIPLDEFAPCGSKDDYLLWIGRICEEKAPHTAIELAIATGHPLVLVGTVYPFSYHQQYFAREITPRLERARGRVRYVSQVASGEKIELLQRARALLVTSTVAETSSLVAMEAAACGSPVVALRRGALAEVVQHGETGLLADNFDGLKQAISDVHVIQSTACRKRAERVFDARRMALHYEQLYTVLTVDAGIRAA